MKKTPLFILIFSLIFIISCNKNSYKSGKNISQATGWKINSSDGGFKLNSKYKGQINAPGMIFIQEVHLLREIQKIMLCMIGITLQRNNMSDRFS